MTTRNTSVPRHCGHVLVAPSMTTAPTPPLISRRLVDATRYGFPRPARLETWLHKKAIAAGRLRLVLDSTERMAGEHDNSGISRARIATQATREVQTGHARKAHVGNDHVRLEATGALEAIRPRTKTSMK